MPIQSIYSYRSYDEFSELVDHLFDDISSNNEPETNFCPKVGRMAGDLRSKQLLKTFGHKVGTGLPTSKVSTGRKREQSIYTWIRNRISGLDCGVEVLDDTGAHPIHINKNERVLAFFDGLRRGEKSWLKKISNQNFADHVTNVATFYFAGTSQARNPNTLVLTDIDCKKTGTLKGAMEFAGHLEKHHFPNLYIEGSTHGNGAHGYFVLKKGDYGATYINDLLLHRLQPRLRQIMQEQGFDVENVEIKGTLPVIVWGDKKLEVTN